MIADVAFDAPVPHPFAYRVPSGWTLTPGQRVLARLRGASRVGMVVDIREGPVDALKPLDGVVEPETLVGPAQLEMLRWISSESLSSIGSTALALLPPPAARPVDSEGNRGRGIPPREIRTGPEPELLTGSGRERMIIERIASAAGTVVVITADVEAAARWAQWLAKLDRVVRLDSGVADAARATAWSDLAIGRARLAVGTRSALLAPAPDDPTLVLIDEHDPAHRPPGHPRIHSRDVLFERARREGARLLLTSATPSAETWWRASEGLVTPLAGERGSWPVISIADTRGILRREPITPELARAMRETLATGNRIFLAVSRVASALSCDECGLWLRCDVCGVALAYTRAAPALGCRMCNAAVALPDTCPGCGGHRLSPFGWGIERVEHAVRRRFPRARVVRYDPEARGTRRSPSRADANAADVVIGTRGALRLFGPGSLGLAAFVSPDQLMRLPDFRAGERLCALVWAAAERVKPGGSVIIQSQHPSHHAFAAAQSQDLDLFYGPELAFRAELGYPPFRRLALITVRRDGSHPALADDVVAMLRGGDQLIVYGPMPSRRRQERRIVVKGEADLPGLLGRALAEFCEVRRGSRGIIDVEVDPIEWLF